MVRTFEEATAAANLQPSVLQTASRARALQEAVVLVSSPENPPLTVPDSCAAILLFNGLPGVYV